MPHYTTPDTALPMRAGPYRAGPVHTGQKARSLPSPNRIPASLSSPHRNTPDRLSPVPYLAPPKPHHTRHSLTVPVQTRLYQCFPRSARQSQVLFQFNYIESGHLEPTERWPEITNTDDATSVLKRVIHHLRADVFRKKNLHTDAALPS